MERPGHCQPKDIQMLLTVPHHGAGSQWLVDQAWLWWDKCPDLSVPWAAKEMAVCMLLSIFQQLYTSGHVPVGDPDSLRAFRACTGGVQTTFSPKVCDSRWACADSPHS